MGGSSTKEKVFPTHESGFRDFQNQGYEPSSLKKPGNIVVCNDDIRSVYTFIKPVGKGDHTLINEVHLTINPKKRFAVKSLDKETLLQSKNNFFGELIMLRVLDHPTTIKFYEAYEDAEYFHLVLELCSGDTLDKRVKSQSRLPEDFVVKVMYQAFTVIKHLHKLGIVHREVNADNFMFINNNYPDIKLIDFGFARYFVGHTLSTLDPTMEQLMFCAPEALSEKYDERIDNWSLGVLLFYLLSGKKPFRHKKIEVLRELVIKGKYSFIGNWRNVSPAAKDLVKKLLVVDPEHRFTASEALNHPFFKSMHIPPEKIEVKVPVAGRLKHLAIKPFKYEILKILIRLLNHNDEAPFRAMFDYFDKDGNGIITESEFLEVMKEMGYEFTLEQVESIFSLLRNGDKRNGIMFSEFVISMYDKREFFTKERLVDVFQYFDRENKGEINSNTAYITLARRGRRFEDDVILKMIKESDLNNNAVIDMNELAVMLKMD